MKIICKSKLIIFLNTQAESFKRNVKMEKNKESEEDKKRLHALTFGLFSSHNY